MFYDTIDENVKFIIDSYKKGKYQSCKDKIHVVKNSAKLIGANEFMMECQNIEKAIKFFHLIRILFFIIVVILSPNSIIANFF